MEPKVKTKGTARLLELGEAMSTALGSDRFEWQTMKIFLTVCLHGGEVPMQEIEKATGWSQAAISRNIAKLGAGITMDDAGARLVETFEDPQWRRRKIVRITARGRELAAKLQTFMSNGNSH